MKTVRLKQLMAGPEGVFNAGQVAVLDAATAETLIASRQAEEVHDEETQELINSLPGDVETTIDDRPRETAAPSSPENPEDKRADVETRDVSFEDIGIDEDIADLLRAGGIESIKDITDAAQLTKIKGIGRVRAVQILENVAAFEGK